MSKHSVAVVSLLSMAALLGACATGGSGGRGWRNQRPLLYPNAHYRAVGPEQADMDIAQCMYLAERGAGPGHTAGDTAVNTVGGAAGGAALGAIGGAIAGNAGTGAAIGAATGAALGLGKSAYDSSKPSQNYQGYTQACLQEKGYQVTGWQ